MREGRRRGREREGEGRRGRERINKLHNFVMIYTVGQEIFTVQPLGRISPPKSVFVTLLLPLPVFPRLPFLTITSSFLTRLLARRSSSSLWRAYD